MHHVLVLRRNALHCRAFRQGCIVSCCLSVAVAAVAAVSVQDSQLTYMARQLMENVCGELNRLASNAQANEIAVEAPVPAVCISS